MLDNKISLRPIEVNDGIVIFSIINNNRQYLRKWLTFIDTTNTPDFTVDYIKSTSLYKNDGDIVYVIEYDSILIGLIGFESINTYRRKAELGYWISTKFEGKGIMSYSVKKMLKIGFELFKFHRIEIKCAVGNNRSSAIAKNCHFILEGIERDGELLSNGKYVDVQVYSLLSMDYWRTNSI